MQIELTPEAKTDLEFWENLGKTEILQKIEKLLDSILDSPKRTK